MDWEIKYLIVQLIYLWLNSHKFSMNSSLSIYYKVDYLNLICDMFVLIDIRFFDSLEYQEPK